MECLADTGALGPTGTDSGGEGDDGDFAIFESTLTELLKILRRRGLRKIGDFLGKNVFDVGVGREAILRKSDPSFAEVAADRFMLLGVEAVNLEKFFE
jgi:hypothetical protein